MRLTGICVAWLAAGVLLAACGSPEQRADKLLAQAGKLADRADEAVRNDGFVRGGELFQEATQAIEEVQQQHEGTPAAERVAAGEVVAGGMDATQLQAFADQVVRMGESERSLFHLSVFAVEKIGDYYYNF